MSDTSRLFFALWPDDQTRQVLTRLAHSIAIKEFNWVQPHNFHVTLVFLGSIDTKTESLIKKAVIDMTTQPFTLTFDSLSHWSKPGILCLTCRQSLPEEAIELVSMLEAVAANCGLHTDTRPYTPHITLARHSKYLPNITIEPIVWHAEAFCLIESRSEPDGVRYKVIQQWPFTKPAVNPDQ